MHFCLLSNLNVLFICVYFQSSSRRVRMCLWPTLGLSVSSLHFLSCKYLLISSRFNPLICPRSSLLWMKKPGWNYNCSVETNCLWRSWEQKTEKVCFSRYPANDQTDPIRIWSWRRLFPQVSGSSGQDWRGWGGVSGLHPLPHQTHPEPEEEGPQVRGSVRAGDELQGPSQRLFTNVYKTTTTCLDLFVDQIVFLKRNSAKHHEAPMNWPNFRFSLILNDCVFGFQPSHNDKYSNPEMVRVMSELAKSRKQLKGKEKFCCCGFSGGGRLFTWDDVSSAELRLRQSVFDSTEEETAGAGRWDAPFSPVPTKDLGTRMFDPFTEQKHVPSSWKKNVWF